MFKRLLCTILFLIFAFTGCSGIEVSQDYDEDAELSALSLYAWQTGTQAKTGDVRVDNPLLDKRIRKAVETNLENKGMQKSANATPDFLVKYDYVIRQKVRSSGVRTGVGFGFGSYGRYGGVGISQGSDVRTYDEGLLVIDVLEPGSGKLFWRGQATFYVSEHSKPEDSTKEINNVIQKVLNQFPPN